MTTTGVVFIHSAPAAMRPHIEWALGGVFGAPIELSWLPQPAEPGTQRAEFSWQGPVGAASKVASALKRWDRLRFEVTEHASAQGEGVRYSYTPTLGVFQAPVAASGDILVHEDHIRTALARHSDQGALCHALSTMLGEPWDAELDVFRAAEEGAAVRWLHRVG